MKDIFCVAAFAGKVLCLMVFVTVLKPDGSIGTVWTSEKPVDCRMERSKMQECELNLQRIGKPTTGHALHVQVSVPAE
jgi:hypothetical protein